jgi:hypothetical protein
MARTKAPFRPGKGAKATVLTRFIKPSQPLPTNNKKHRSTIVLLERDEDNRGKTIFRFRYELEDNEDTPLMYANHQWVSLVKEGDPNDLFDGPGGPRQKEETIEEPKIKWKNSMGRKILYEDIKAGTLSSRLGFSSLQP